MVSVEPVGSTVLQANFPGTRRAAMKPLTIIIPFVLLHASISYQGNNGQNEQDPQPSRLLFTPEVGLQKPREGLDDGRGQQAQSYHSRRCSMGRRPCGDEKQCCCGGNMASCAGQGLTRIPSGLPANITWLDFSFNSLNAIEQFTLQNVTSLVSLNLQNNHISFVHPKAFASMKELRMLKLGDNNLTDFSGLMSALGYTDQLKYLNANSNMFRNVCLSALSDVPALNTLVLCGNSITRISKGERRQEMSHLQILDVSSNLLASFPDFCRSEAEGESFLPHLHTFNIEWNVITIMAPEAAKCLPNLNKLSLGGNAIRHIQKNFLQGFPRLEKLTLQFCMSKNIDSHAFNHSSLKYLDVSENLWFFDSHYGSGINPDLFRDVPQLQFINMSWTVFRFSQIQERRMILSSLQHVKEFVLLGTGLDFIPEEVLQGFTDLRLLNFGSNEIPFLADDTFENLTSLTSLDLHENHLTSVSQQLLGGILSRPNASIDLSHNPFACTCDLLWFIEHYQEDHQRKEGPRIFSGGTYMCKSPDSQLHVDLAHVGITRQKCALDQEAYLVILFITCFMIVLFIVGSLIYRYRWQLRFMLYSLQHRLSRDADRPVPDHVYDIFVSYDSNDSQWVTGTLMPELEGRRGLRLCVHERDFTPGMFITHNIIEKMEESGAIMPLVSSSFLTSDWCRFELFMAFKNALRRRGGPSSARASDPADEPAQHGRIAIVPVLLEDVEREGVDSLLCTVLNTTTYLAWPGGLQGGSGTGCRERERERFWNTLCSVVEKQGGSRRRGSGSSRELGEI